MSDSNNSPKKGPTEIPASTGSVEKRQKVHASRREGSDEVSNRKKQSQKLDHDFVASFESSEGPQEVTLGEKPSSTSNEEKRNRELKINRLSAYKRRIRDVFVEESDTELGKELKRDIDATLGEGNRVRYAFFPGSLQRLGTKRILTAASDERVPETDGKTQPLFHGLSQNDFIGIVVAKGKWVRAIGALVGDLGNVGEEFGRHIEIDSLYYRERLKRNDEEWKRAE
jgi:hypothetical protein